MLTNILSINFSGFFASLQTSTKIIIAILAVTLVLLIIALVFRRKKNKKPETSENHLKKDNFTTVHNEELKVNSNEESFEEPNFADEVAAVNEQVTTKKNLPKHEKAKAVVVETQLSQEEQTHLNVLKRIFVNRLYQSDTELKKNYSAIKNELLSFIGVISRVSAPCDSFKTNKEQIAKVNIDGKKLIVYLKLNPSLPEYNDGTCPHRDMGHKKMYADVPFRFTITSGLALRRCIRLVDDMMANLKLEKNSAFKKTDYIALYPYLSDEELLKLDNNATPALAVKKIKDNNNEETIAKSVEQEVAASLFEAPEISLPVINRKIVGKEGDIDILKRVFVNRLHQADEELKENYSVLKNELLSYRGVKSRLSAPCDTFRANKEEICKINIDGKKLIVYLNLDTNHQDYNDGTCPHRDMGHKYMYKSVPFRFTITSGLALRRAIKLISDMMTNFNYVKNPRYKNVDFAALYPYMDDAMLLSKFNGQ